MGRSQGERETPIWSYPEHNSRDRGGGSCNSPQWRGWWWAWRCSAPPPRWPPPPCSAPPPGEEGLCRPQSPTDAAETHRNTVIYQQPTQCVRPHTRSHLDFRDGDSCFWVLIQHPLNELLQLLSDQRPEREATPLLLNVASPQAHFDQSGAKRNEIQLMWLLQVCLRLWELHAFALDLVVQRDDILVVERTLLKGRIFLKKEASDDVGLWTKLHLSLQLLTLPKTKQNSVTPIAHTSNAWSTNRGVLSFLALRPVLLFSPHLTPTFGLTFPLKPWASSFIISGAMKAGVPAVHDRRASAPSNSLLTPKSAILTWPLSPSSRLDGLMSLWMILW